MSVEKKITVYSDFYGGSHGIDEILNDYYEREIRKIGTKEEQDLARKFIEEGLIIEGNRVSVSEAGAINQFALSEDLLQRLRTSRLIRAENTHLGKAYEVSHDTLVAPILTSFEKRKRIEEQVEATKRLEEEHQALQKEKQKKRRANIIAALGFLLFFIALIALFKAVQLNKEARQQNRIARSNELTAHSTFETQNKKNVTKGYGLIKAALDFDDNAEARKGLFWTYYKSVNNPSNYFYVQNLNCQNSNLLSAYYSPFGTYISINAWNGKSCLLDKNGTPIRTFKISTTKPRLRTAFSSDEKRMMVMAENNEIEIYELDKLNKDTPPAVVLNGHKATMRMANFSQDGKQILTCDEAGKAMLWDKEGVLKKELSGADIYYANFSHDAQHILTISKNGTIQIRNAVGLIQKQIENLKGSPDVVSLSPDANYFAVSSIPFSVKIWNWEGTLVTTLKGHEDYVNDISWSPDSKWIATSSPDKTAKIWTINGQLQANMTEHNASVLSVDFAPDGQHVLTSSLDNRVLIWDRNGTWVGNLSGHFEKVTSAMFHPEGKKVLSFSEKDNTVKEWAKADHPVIDLKVESEEVFVAKYASDGKKVITCGTHKAIIWEQEGKDGKFNAKAKLEGHKSGVLDAAFSPDNQLVATASYDYTAKIWSMEGDLIADLNGHKEQIPTLDWAPDGETLVTSSYDKTVKVWTKAGALLYTLKHDHPTLCAAYDHSGKYIVTAGDKGEVKLWEQNAQLITTLEGHTGLVVDAVFSPDGSYLVTASGDGTARIWDLESSEHFGSSIVLDAHTSGIKSVDISSDGQYIVTGSKDRTAIVWNRKGELRSVLSGHESTIQETLFSPDGRMVATASSDNSAKIWNLEGLLISDMLGHTNTVNDVCFSLDGKKILTAASDHTAKIWPIISVQEVIRDLDGLGVVELSESTKNKYHID